MKDPALYPLIYGNKDGWSGLSGSNAGAANECPARMALPQAKTTGDWAERGNELHEFARAARDPAKREAALLAVPEKYRHTATGMNLDLALDGIDVKGAEWSFALDVEKRSVRFIGENIERRYEETLKAAGKAPLGRYEIPMSMDINGFVLDGTVPCELDYKSGKSIGDPADHWQRRLCASALMFYYDTATAISRVGYIWEDGTISHDGCQFTCIDAEEFCDEMVETIDAVWEARDLLFGGIMPTVYPSESACSYCPAFRSCPYQTNFVAAMAGKLEAIEKGPKPPEIGPEELGRVWSDLKRAEKIAEETLKAIKPIITSAEPLPIGDTKEVRPAERSKSYFDDSKARGMIVTLLGRLGKSDAEIAEAVASLTGKSTYFEYRTVNREGIEKPKKARKKKGETPEVVTEQIKEAS